MSVLAARQSQLTTSEAVEVGGEVGVNHNVVLLWRRESVRPLPCFLLSCTVYIHMQHTCTCTCTSALFGRGGRSKKPMLSTPEVMMGESILFSEYTCTCSAHTDIHVYRH